MEKAAEKLGTEVTGVPFIIIGKQTFPGYASSMNEQIESLIKEEYEKEDRYDVMKELGVDTTVSNSVVENNAKDSSTSDIIILVISVLIIGGVVVLVVMARKQN